jgi:DNA-3-methyladenine glycosylase
MTDDGRFTDFERDPVTVARRLLGQRLVRIVRGRRRAGLIVEVEAYLGAPDRAAHTWDGRRTPRNESMYLPGGHAYVYFTYGMHHCMNVVCGRRDEGVAVLLRAIEPTEGLDVMRARRAAARRPIDLCSGPARLTQALDIDRACDGLDLREGASLFIERTRRRALPTSRIGVGPRVGIGYAAEWAQAPLRFWVRDNPHVSRTRRTRETAFAGPNGRVRRAPGVVAHFE